MDAGAVGAVIGIGAMIAIGICIRVYDYYHERKRPIVATKGTPLLVRRHSKMNTLLPK